MNDVELTKLEENLIKTEAEFVTEMKKLHGESVSLSSVLSLFVLLKFLVFSLPYTYFPFYMSLFLSPIDVQHDRR